ncbi:MAG: hypothetical protein JNM78_20530 [Cyclobacteriaceae bacterium]|nr:hypothetical protein [Cyclobacteriaceae bacterium]
MKKYGFLISSLYFLILSGFIACENKEVSYWDAIDQNSVLIFETIHRPTTDKTFLPFFKNSSPSFIVALQSVSKHEFELLYTFPLLEKEYELLLKDTSLTQSKQRIVSRVYNGIAIKEILDEKNKVNSAFAYSSGILFLSKSSFLIETAIRILISEGGGFRPANKNLFQFASIKSDAGNLYVNFSKLSQLTLINSSLTESIPLLKQFAKSSMLDVKVDNDFISMNGFTIDSLNQNLSLSVFQNQSAVKFGAARFIPNYSRVTIHYGFSDFVKLIHSFRPSDSLKLYLSDELAVCETDQKSFLIFAKLENNSLLIDSGSYFESYAGYEIRGIKDDIVSKSLAGLIPKGSYDYYTVKENYAFFSTDVIGIKSLIDAIESDDTWGKSLAFQRFYEKGLQESNLSIFFRSPAFSDKNVNEKWLPLLDSLKLSSLSWASMQFTSLDNHFYTSVNLEKLTRKTTNRRSSSMQATFNVPNKIAKGWRVKSHVSTNDDLILQDSTYHIYLFSTNERTLWEYHLDGMIQGISEIDYFKNNKLQYFITTPTSIYIIDRLGRNLQGFPKKSPVNTTYSELVDYDKSKNYRFLLASADGDVYVLDKEVTSLEGWNPKQISSRIKSAPKHYRIGGRDYYLIVTEDGAVHIFSRRGDYENGYPLKMKPFSGDYFLEMGTKLSNTFLYTVSSDGIATKRGLDTKIVSQENLVKGNNSTFSLVATQTGKSNFFYIRTDTDKIAVFNKQNQLVFEKQNPGSASLVPSVLSLSEGRTIFCFYDSEQKFSFLYDQLGNSVLNRPLESSVQPIFGLDNKNSKFFIYSFFEDAVTVTPIY